MNSPKTKRLPKVLKWLLLPFLLLLLSISYYLNTLSSEEPKEDKIPVVVEVQKEEIPEPVEQVIPDLTTQFFSEENKGKALIYYSIVNDSIKFFNREGVDPSTGEKLLPVTEQIVKRFKEEKEPKKKLAVVDTRNFKVNEIKIVKKEKKKKVKKKPKRTSMYNTKLFNSNEQDEISLFVFNAKDQIDTLFVDQFKTEFNAKNYFVTPTIIYWDMLNPLIIDRLKNSDINYFDGNLKKYTDYVCIALVEYSYNANSYRNDLTDCTARIDYFIYDAGSGEELFSEQDKLIGSGQTKSLARKDAIGKFVL